MSCFTLVSPSITIFLVGNINEYHLTFVFSMHYNLLQLPGEIELNCDTWSMCL